MHRLLLYALVSISIVCCFVLDARRAAIRDAETAGATPRPTTTIVPSADAELLVNRP